ncbi:MAG: hypothetical protein RXN91_09040, partial [Caldivirga sp.]
MPVGLGKLTLVGLVIGVAAIGLVAGFLAFYHPAPSVTGIYWPSYLVFPRFAPTSMLYVVNLTGTNYYTNYSVYTL